MRYLVLFLFLVAGAGCRDAHAQAVHHDHATAPSDCPCHHHHGGGVTVTPRANTPLPGLSLYHLDATWTTQDGAQLSLASFRGHPVVVLMFFGTCRGACPVLVRDVQRIESALSESTRQNTRFVLITFDPEHDTPANLRALATEDHLDLTRWTLLNGRDGDVRAVAAALGVQYARTPQGFDHSNQITLLDAEGTPAFALEGLGQPIEEFVRRVEAVAR